MNGSSSLPRHWLVFRLGHLGDVVLCTGVLSWLAETRGWSFTFVTRRTFADIFSGNPHVRAVVALGERDLQMLSFASLARRLAREHHGQGLLNLHGGLRSRLLGLRWQGPVLHYPKMSLERRLFLFSQGRLCGEKLRSATVPQRYCLATGAPPPSVSALLPRIWLTEEEKEKARQRIATLFGRELPPLALHPFATHALKAWPLLSWNELVSRLDQARLPWMMLGKGKALFPDRPEDLSNVTSLRETCALLSQCRALVTGDSGPMHLAQAVGAPVIALFGPTTREWGFFPAGPCDQVLENRLPCRPCSLHGKKNCPREGECLRSISPDTVFKAVTAAPYPHNRF